MIDAPSNLQNRIEGNLIGVDRAGTRALAGGGGVADRGTDTVIGGPDPAAQNVIAGVSLDGTHALLQNNLIGTDVTGTADATTAQIGVGVSGNDNRILDNTIAFHDGNGIQLTGSGTLISGNAIFANLGAGISMGQVFGPQTEGNLISQNSIFAERAHRHRPGQSG